MTSKVAELVDAYKPLRIVAFGSWARGEARPNSDLDLAVILDDSAASSNLEKLEKTLTENGLQMPSPPIDLKEVTKYATVWRYYIIPEADDLDLTPLRETVKMLREHVLAQIDI